MRWPPLVPRVMVPVMLVVACGESSSPVATTTPPLSAPPTTSVTTPAPPRSTTATATTATTTTVTTTPSVDPSTWPELVRWGAVWGPFDEPVDVVFHPVTATAYVVERSGVVVRVDVGGRRLEPDAVDLRSVVRSGGEQGLLGLTFDGDGSRAFVNFTDRDGDTIVAAFTVADDGTFDGDSRRDLLRIDQPYRNHNGGEVLMGPDGALWIPTGDGGSADDPERVALDPGSLLGKVLRLDPDTGAVEVWASGLRNPWRASFDALTGDLWIADVGQGSWEEISVASADTEWARGRHFGWSAFEGTHPFNADAFSDDVTVEDHVPPLFEYPHGDEGCSITGGVRYRGSGLVALQGAYVFSDYCSGRVRALPVDPALTVGAPVDLEQLDRVVAVRADTAGEIWVVSIDGEIRQLISAD